MPQACSGGGAADFFQNFRERNHEYDCAAYGCSGIGYAFGGEHSFDSMGTTAHASEPGQENLEEGLHEISFSLRDYPWDTVELKLNFTRETAFSPAIAVELQ